MQTPGTKGTFILHRVATAADDPTQAALLDKKLGVNLVGYRYALVQAIPINTNAPPPDPSKWKTAGVTIGTSNPTFDAWFWNETLGLWVLAYSWDSPNVHFGNYGATAGVPVDLNIEVDGRAGMLLTLKNAPTAGQGVAFFVSAQRAAELL